MDSNQELGSISSSIADLTKRIEALEQALRENPLPITPKSDGHEGGGDTPEEEKPAVRKEGLQPEKSEAVEIDLLRKHVEFRKEVWVNGNTKKEWVSDGEVDLETADLPSGKHSFRFDTPETGEFIFTVYKSAALYNDLYKLCPPAHEGQVKSFSDRLEITGAYPLVHCRDELMAMEDTETDEKMRTELKIMRQLYERKPHLIRVQKHQDELLMKQKIDSDGLKGLFHTGQLVVFRELRDEWVVARVRTSTVFVKSDKDMHTEPRGRPPGLPPILAHLQNIALQLECEAIDFDGKKFRNHLYRKQIKQFAGTKNITELEIYPISYHYNKDVIIRDSIRSGKRWHKLHRQLTTPGGQPVARVMQYVGYCETFSDDEDKDGIGREIAGRVIVDPTRFPDRGITFLDHNVDPFHSEHSSEEDEDDPLVLCPERVLVYSLNDNEWYYVAMRKLEFPTWIPSAWERLVKPDSQPSAHSIDRIKLLAKAHADANQSKEAENDLNNFRGKGKGLTFLLHGPPGVGKTMVAECLSEEHQRPLYRVNLGMLVADNQWESKIEEIFRQAHFWDAFLLIDEAEVVMSERTPESMHSLAWVAVFLRKIEYFEGVLFLTTNQIHMIDPAFISRVNLGMAFPELNSETRLQIWKKILSDLGGSNAAWLSEDEQQLRKWAKKPLNGRQIRNVVYSARLLSGSTEGNITAEGVENCLDDVIKFMDMIKEEKKTIEMNYMSHWS